MKLFETRHVLAGAYRGFLKSERLDGRTLRSHYYEVTEGAWGAAKTLCGRVLGERLSDLAEKEEATCPVCAERFGRLVEKGKATKAP